MTLRDDDWLPASHVADLATKAFSSVIFVHEQDSIDLVKMHKLRTMRGFPLQNYVGFRVWITGHFKRVATLDALTKYIKDSVERILVPLAISDSCRILKNPAASSNCKRNK